MPVDVERLTVADLLTQTAITAEVDQRIYTEIPASPVFPLVRVTLIDQTPVFSRPAVLANALVQFDIYGGPKVQARRIADAIVARLDSDAFHGTHTLGVVTCAEIGSLRWLPDASYPVAKNRYVLDAEIYTRP